MTEQTPAPAREVLVVSGMSGAGRSTAADVIEDLGWFVVENLPAPMLYDLVELVEAHGETRLAIVVDVRSRTFFAALRGALAGLAERGVRPQVLYLEASDDVLVRRFESVRRPHPLQGSGRVLDGIRREREMLADLRGDADLVVDTSTLNVHQLAAKIATAFGREEAATLRATVMSFGFKYGIPVDADLVIDMRFLPNPHWVPELRPHSGLDADVSAYVLEQPEAKEFLDAYAAVLRVVLRGYLREGKRYVTVAVGCTGGKHRSVTMSEEVGRRLRGEGIATLVVHRDLGRE
jgi:UPF0042 nucleotide-binding protein